MASWFKNTLSKAAERVNEKVNELTSPSQDPEEQKRQIAQESEPKKLVS